MRFPSHTDCSGVTPRTDGLSIQAGTCSEVGPIRDRNEDLTLMDTDRRLFVVLDGVGGHRGGDKASRILMEQLHHSVAEICQGQPTPPKAESLGSAIHSGIQAARAEMERIACQDSAYEHMGTVFALAVLKGDQLLYTHVGDCRVYLFRNQTADQMTVDETFVELMADIGVIQRDEIKDHPLRHVILNSVGPRNEAEQAVVSSETLRPGDRIVLTSDGVTDFLEVEQLEQILRGTPDAQAAADAVVRAALDAGGRDNASCIVVSYGLDPDAAAHRADLHRELANLAQLLAEPVDLDDACRQELATLEREIKTLLQGPVPTEAVNSLHDRLQEAMLGVETRHPHVTTLVGRIAELLSNFGI